MKNNCKNESAKIQDRKSHLKKEINYMSNGKAMIIYLIAGVIKKINQMKFF